MTRSALIIAHGQPSDPDRAEADLAALAAAVAAHLPTWNIGSATLAAPGALARAIALHGPQGRAYPLFMAGGWFTRSHLPAKLAEAGGPGWQVQEPLGCDPALHDLAVQIAAESGASSLILAAHGSSRSPVPSAVARHVAARISTETGIPTMAAFIDQSPQLAKSVNHDSRAACLPFFAASGGHVTDDIPAALLEAGFSGTLLPAIGTHPVIPSLIAAGITAGIQVCAGDCRWHKAN